MLIVIPTFKRTESVRLVLQSLLLCDLPHADEEFRVAVVNNFPPNREEIEHIISEVWNSNPRSSLWQLTVINREKTLPLIENWYSAIHALAKENEIFILQGDDDLFTPWSLLARYQAFLKSGADLVLTHSFSGLTFLESKRGLHYSGELPIVNQGSGNLVSLDFVNFEHYSPVFIGSQAYRYNTAFRNALETVGQWTSRNTWLDHHHRTIMVAYYIVVASIHLGSRVMGLDVYGCIRGTSLGEKLYTPYNSSREANSSFLSLVMLMILQNKDLAERQHELRVSLESSSHHAANWFLTNYLDRRVDKKALKQLLKLNPVNLKLSNWMFGISIILRQHLGLKYIRLRTDLIFGRRVFTGDQFLKILSTKTI